MKTQLYKLSTILFTFCFLGTTFAQKVDEKFTENFEVDKNVKVFINATNTDVNVTTWSKNEVEVKAFIEIEGLSKKEAQKYIDKWKFEALGNSKKVNINAKGDNSTDFENNFVYFNNQNFKFPKIDIIDFDSLKFPEMDFNFDMEDLDFIIPDMDFDIDKFIEKDGQYNIKLRNGGNAIVIKSKKEWEAFKKTQEYEELKKDLSEGKEKFKKEWASSKEKFKQINKEEIKRELEKEKIEFQKIDSKKIREELAKATEELKKLKFNFFSDKNEKELVINGKKVIIKKRLEIKVPKSATFNLNTRHCKVKLPDTIASGKVSYGSFDANNLNGGELEINYSPVSINDLNACTLFLNNVTKAKIASVTNSIMNNNSSVVNINLVNENVEIIDSFGQLKIKNLKINPQNFILILDNSDVDLDLSVSNSKLKFYATSMVLPNNSKKNKKITVFNGYLNANNDDKTISIKGKNSKLTINRAIL
jgi:hypothetical protein